MRQPSGTRWKHVRVRRLLRPASRPALDAWVSRQGRSLRGLVLNVGAGEDERTFGRRTIRLDAHAPSPTVRADLAAALPFRSGTFDAAVCTEVLEHVRYPSALLHEIARVLKPGAPAIVTVPFFFHYHPDPEDHRRFTPDGLRCELEQAGFHVRFIGGLGGKIVAALMLIDSTNPLVKAALRLLLLPFGALLAARQPINGEWSDCAANVVALASVCDHASS